MTELDKMTILIEKGWTHNKKTGEIKTSRGGTSKCKAANGYQVITSSSEGNIFTVYAHRFAWFAHYKTLPKNGLDHINGNRLDNRLENLRDVSHQINCHNKHKAKGYFYNSKTKKYRATLGINNKYVQLGHFDTAEEAVAIYKLAKKLWVTFLMTLNK